MDIIRLDLRLICGNKFDQSTPKCVIEQVTEYSGVGYDSEFLVLTSYLTKISSKINDKDFKEINVKTFDVKTLELIKPFVSPIKCEWTEVNLLIAFKHMLQYCTLQEPPLPDQSFKFGHKSEEEPRMYNALMLYRICQYYHLQTNLETSIEEMASKVSMLIFPLEELRKTLMYNVSVMERSELINLYHSKYVPEIKPIVGDSPISIPISSHDEENNPDKLVLSLETCKDKIFNPSKLLHRIEPKTQEEAVIVTAFVYHLNFCDAKNPLEQYRHLKSLTDSGKCKGHYLPRNDPDFLVKFRSNRDWYNITMTWCPQLHFLYNEELLRKMLILEGYLTNQLPTSKTELISLLNHCRDKFNVYLSKVPYCTNSNHTLVNRDPITEIDSNLILCCGSVNHKTLYYITVSEFDDFLNSKNLLVDPVYSTRLDAEVIRKLKNFLKNPSSESYVNAYNKLLKTINSVERQELMRDKYTTLITSLEDKHDKEKLIQLFEKLIYLSFYMRNWQDGLSEYPIKSDVAYRYCSTYSKPEDIERRDLKIFNEVNACFSIIEDDLPPNLRTLVYELPTIKKDSKHIYCIPTTLVETIRKISHVEVVASCIRTLSNSILVSALTYGRLLGKRSIFEQISIEEIDLIF